MRFATTVALLFLGACGSFEPVEGTWLYTTVEVLEDTCGGQVTQSTGEFSVYVAEDDTLVIDPEDGTDPFLCAQSNKDFTCPTRLALEEPVDGFDATVTVDASAEGTFSAADEATGTMTATGDCAGSDCALLSAYAGISFPCTVSESFVIVASDL